LHFSSLFTLILLVAFLAFSSLGAGLDKRAQKPLGAHQERISIANEREQGCCNLQPNYVSCIGNLASIRSLCINASSHHSRRFTPIICFALHFAPRNRKNLAPNKRTISYSQTEENSKMEDCLHVNLVRAKQ
jgi:hypothetical protein